MAGPSIKELMLKGTGGAGNAADAAPADDGGQDGGEKSAPKGRLVIQAETPGKFILLNGVGPLLDPDKKTPGVDTIKKVGGAARSFAGGVGREASYQALSAMMNRSTSTREAIEGAIAAGETSKAGLFGAVLAEKTATGFSGLVRKIRERRERKRMGAKGQIIDG